MKPIPRQFLHPPVPMPSVEAAMLVSNKMAHRGLPDVPAVYGGEKDEALPLLSLELRSMLVGRRVRDWIG